MLCPSGRYERGMPPVARELEPRPLGARLTQFIEPGVAAQPNPPTRAEGSSGRRSALARLGAASAVLCDCDRLSFPRSDDVGAKINEAPQ